MSLTVLCPPRWNHSGRSIACFARVGHQIAVQIFVDIPFIVGCNAGSVEVPGASLAAWIFRIRIIRSARGLTSNFDLQNGPLTPFKNGLKKKPVVKRSCTARPGLPVIRLKKSLTIDCVPIVCQIGCGGNADWEYCTPFRAELTDVGNRPPLNFSPFPNTTEMVGQVRNVGADLIFTVAVGTVGAVKAAPGTGTR